MKTPILAKPSESELANEILREVTVLKPIFAPINVTFHRYNGKVYFFHQDGTYSRLDRNTCQLEYYAPISYWNGWPLHWKCPDAAVSWDTQHVYFFKGSEYLRYDMDADQVEYTASIQKYWQAWPSYWDRVDAALYWDCHFEQYKTNADCSKETIPWRRKIYFFRGKEYLRYDLANDRVDQGYPIKIRDGWAGWPEHWTRVQGAFDWGNGKIYFFSEKEYLRYDKFFDKVDNGYPRLLVDFFKEHEDKISEENNSLIFENLVPAPQRDKFIKAVREISKQIGIRPNWLMASIWMESGFNPKSVKINKGEVTFVGLHQMSPQLIYLYWGKTSSMLRTSYPHLFWGQPFEALEPEAR